MLAALVMAAAMPREYVVVFPKGEISLSAPVERVQEVMGHPDTGRLAESSDYASWERAPGAVEMRLENGMVTSIKLARSDYNAAYLRLPDWSNPDKVTQWNADPNKLTFSDIYRVYDEPYKVVHFGGEGEVFLEALYIVGMEGWMTMAVQFRGGLEDYSLEWDAKMPQKVEFLRGKPVNAIELMSSEEASMRYPEDPPSR
jgi:hypothetical protein